MKIYTSYFSNIKKLPDNIKPIAICRFPPKGYKGAVDKGVSPPAALLNKYKYNKISKDEYIKEYITQLDKFDYIQLIQYWKSLVGNFDIALVCYESPDKFCHRQLLAMWLNMNGLDVKEWSATKECD